MIYDVLMAFIEWGYVHYMFFGWTAFFGILAIVNAVVRIPRFILSTMKVMTRGWPPSHLDADGDWKPKNDEA